MYSPPWSVTRHSIHKSEGVDQTNASAFIIDLGLPQESIDEGDEVVQFLLSRCLNWTANIAVQDLQLAFRLWNWALLGDWLLLLLVDVGQALRELVALMWRRSLHVWLKWW
jgi:hypothetical protein